MHRFFNDESGMSAIEFAIIAPLLCLMFLGIGSSWSYMQQVSVMRDSVEAIAKYYIQGGTSETQATSIGNTTWTNKPTGGTLTITRSKSCGSTTVTTSNCPDGSIPYEQLVVDATSTWTDPTSIIIFPNGLSLEQSETIRVR